MKTHMLLERETKGALLYKEISADGKAVDQSIGNLNSLYVRKSSEIGKEKPQYIMVEILPDARP